MDDEIEFSPTERAFVAALLLVSDDLLTRELADLLELSHNGAYKLMLRASRVAPIRQDVDGRWRLRRDTR